MRRFSIFDAKGERVGEGVETAHDVYDGRWIPYACVFDDSNAYFHDETEMRAYFGLTEEHEIVWLDPPEDETPVVIEIKPAAAGEVLEALNFGEPIE